jgi:hypothetical protein
MDKVFAVLVDSDDAPAIWSLWLTKEEAEQEREKRVAAGYPEANIYVQELPVGKASDQTLT